MNPTFVGWWECFECGLIWDGKYRAESEGCPHRYQPSVEGEHVQEPDRDGPPAARKQGGL